MAEENSLRLEHGQGLFAAVLFGARRLDAAFICLARGRPGHYKAPSSRRTPNYYLAGFVFCAERLMILSLRTRSSLNGSVEFSITA